MKPVNLMGLRADTPVGAMAAFGCLRICSRNSKWRNARLSWVPEGGSFHAVLWAPDEWDKETSEDVDEELISALMAGLHAVSSRLELSWSDQIKSASVQQFRDMTRSAALDAQASDRELADWFAAFGTELENSNEKVQQTPFDMSVARQRFLSDAVRLAQSLGSPPAGKKAKSGRDSYREALFGPWKYEDDQHSLGWDPSTLKLGAFTHMDPSPMKNAGVRAAVWLAFESLPLFPCFYWRGLRTRAFLREGKEFTFFWPVWEPPISLYSLQALLGWEGLLAAKPAIAEYAQRGLLAVYRSSRFKPNKYLTSFRNPDLVWGRTTARPA